MSTLVFFHAHPDDEAISTGGTMALASDAGHRVILVVATRGEEGEPVAGVLAEGEQLGDRREAEVRASAAMLGVDEVLFLGYRDSGMVGEPSNDAADSFWRADLDQAGQRLADILTANDASILVGYDPNGVYGHPDHIQVHRVGARAATLAHVKTVYWATANRDLIQQAMDNGAFDDEGDPDPRVNRAEMGMPLEELTHGIDVSAAIERKRAALACHKSQIDEQSMFLAMSDDEFAMAFGTEWFVDAAAHASNPIRSGELGTSLL